MKMTPEIAEFVGALLGDGYIHHKESRYIIGLTGSPKNDCEYYEYLANILRKSFCVNPKIRLRQRGVRLTFKSKPVFEFLTKDLGLPFGREKCTNTFVPHSLYKKRDLCNKVLRGIADTDGSIFTANKTGSPNYPSIEITTSSPKLVGQIRSALQRRGFRVAKSWKYRSKISKVDSYKIPLNGRKNVELWMKEIGFSNKYKYAKAVKILDGGDGIWTHDTLTSADADTVAA